MIDFLWTCFGFLPFYALGFFAGYIVASQPKNEEQK